MARFSLRECMDDHGWPIPGGIKTPMHDYNDANDNSIQSVKALCSQSGGDTFVVRGEVRGEDGTPLADGAAVVRAYDVDLRQEQQLGEQATDQWGRYEVRYGRGQFSRAEKGSADLRVQAFDANDANGEPLVESPIIFNAQAEEDVDLMVGGGQYRGPSEYELLLEELAPVLQDMSPADLTEDKEHQDVTFLSNETGIDPERIVFLILAHRLARETESSPETELSPEVFYGFLRQNLP